MPVRRMLVGSFLVLLATTFPALAQQKKGGKGGGRSRDEVIAAASAYLKQAQAEDGTWTKDSSPGITAIVVTGLLKSGAVGADDPMVAKALAFIESMADAKEGHLATGERVFLKNYITSVNLTALKTSGAARYDSLTTKATAYLKAAQVGAGGEKPVTAENSNFGGFGYNATTRSDLSNTHFVLDGLKAGGVAADDAVYKRATVFVSRMQNLKGEFNDQPWAGKINDGSFIYVLPQEGGKGNPDDPRPGYGSMTAAGVKSLLMAGIGKDDPRVKKGLEWLAKNYSVDINPGREPGAGGQGYYYYLMALAKCYDALGVDTVPDAAGKPRDWRADITRALIGRQKKEGHWANDFGTWMETNPDLCTGYALQTLAICKPKAK